MYRRAYFLPVLLIYHCSEHHSEAERNSFDTATGNMLGPPHERTTKKTAFENTRCVQKIRGKRCYSVGVAVQQSRRVVAPTASLAQKRKKITVYQRMVDDLHKVSSSFI